MYNSIDSPIEWNGFAPDKIFMTLRKCAVL